MNPMANSDPQPPSPPPTNPAKSPATLQHTIQFRVRYSETDQMGTFYNSRPLEWFEMGRSELMRSAGLPYADMESRGVLLPLVEAHVEYLGRARYDDLLELTSVASIEGRARLRCQATIVHAHSRHPVTRGYTIHAFTSPQGKPTRPPHWFRALFACQPG
jgi:acyl-CoA thioester hydrolase